MSDLFTALNALETSEHPEDREAAAVALRLRNGVVGPFEDDVFQIVARMPDFHHKWTPKDVEVLTAFVTPRVWTVEGPGHRELCWGVMRTVGAVLRMHEFANPEPERPAPDPSMFDGVLPSPDAPPPAPAPAPPISDLASIYGETIFGSGNGNGAIPPPNMLLDIAGPIHQVIGHQPDGYSALVASTLKLVEGLVASKVSPDVASGHAVQLMTAFINATKKPAA